MPNVILARRDFAETEHPTEWLRHLVEDQALYGKLLEESGLAGAAYRIARARCRVGELPMQVPTLRELSVAAGELVESTGQPRPDPWLLAQECEDSGMPVITPLPGPVH